MSEEASLDLVAPPLQSALNARGITQLTPVQCAVLDPALDGFDLRIQSRTGSGKTVAIGLVLAPQVEREEGEEAPGPFGLVVVPTRELAAQVQVELSWLLSGLRVRVVAVTGGTSVMVERRALSAGPEIVVGTPGRLLDHLQRGGVDPSRVRAVVLDEADQMLDLGFRDELEGILSRLPADRQTHMVSATFSPEARSLCDRYQKESRMVDTRRPGDAHEDIEHIAHPVLAGERESAVVNLLLASPEDRTLIFVRTRAQASELAESLSSDGFSAAALSGEMEQRERTRTLTAFRSGALRTLVATDVAARGIDVADVTRVIHLDPPENAEALTHRSGRTGRAGKKGTSIMLVPPQARMRVTSLFRQANFRVRWAPPPGEAEVRAAAEERLFKSLAAETTPEEETSSFAGLADALLEKVQPRALVIRMLSQLNASGPCEPRRLTTVPDPQAPRQARPERSGFLDRSDAPRAEGRPMRGPRQAGGGNTRFVPFLVTWGARHGADARRLLALVCRRGGIQGNQVGAIDIGPIKSTFEVDAAVAAGFAEAVAKPDERDARVRIMPFERPADERPARAPRAERQDWSDKPARAERSDWSERPAPERPTRAPRATATSSRPTAGGLTRPKRRAN